MESLFKILHIPQNSVGAKNIFLLCLLGKNMSAVCSADRWNLNIEFIYIDKKLENFEFKIAINFEFIFEIFVNFEFNSEIFVNFEFNFKIFSSLFSSFLSMADKVTISIALIFFFDYYDSFYAKETPVH